VVYVFRVDVTLPTKTIADRSAFRILIIPVYIRAFDLIRLVVQIVYATNPQQMSKWSLGFAAVEIRANVRALRTAVMYRIHIIYMFSVYTNEQFLRATAGTAIARLSHRNSVCPSVRPSVRHTCGSGKNGAS